MKKSFLIKTGVFLFFNASILSKTVYGRDASLDPLLIAEKSTTTAKKSTSTGTKKAKKKQKTIKFNLSTLGFEPTVTNSYTVKSGETLSQLIDRLNTKLPKRSNFTEVIEQILESKGITELPVLIDKLFSGSQGGTELKDISDIEDGDELSFSARIKFEDYLQGANLGTSDFNGSNLTSVDFSKTDLRNALLSETNFKKANLQEANLSNRNLYKVDFTMADLQKADLSSSHLEEVDFTMANLQKANFTDATFGSEVNFKGADLTGAIISKEQLEKAIGVTDKQRAQVVDSETSTEQN